MQISFNGQLLTLPEGQSIATLLEKKGLPPETVIVEYNYQLLKREHWTNVILQDKDNLEVLHFVGGG